MHIQLLQIDYPLGHPNYPHMGQGGEVELSDGDVSVGSLLYRREDHDVWVMAFQLEEGYANYEQKMLDMFETITRKDNVDWEACNAEG